MRPPCPFGLEGWMAFFTNIANAFLPNQSTSLGGETYNTRVRSVSGHDNAARVYTIRPLSGATSSVSRSWNASSHLIRMSMFEGCTISANFSAVRGKASNMNRVLMGTSSWGNVLLQESNSPGTLYLWFQPPFSKSVLNHFALSTSFSKSKDGNDCCLDCIMMHQVRTAATVSICKN